MASRLESNRASLIRRKPVPSVSSIDDAFFPSIDGRSQTGSPMPRDPTPPQTRGPTIVPVAGSAPVPGPGRRTGTFLSTRVSFTPCFRTPVTAHAHAHADACARAHTRFQTLAATAARCGLIPVGRRCCAAGISCDGCYIVRSMLDVDEPVSAPPAEPKRPAKLAKEKPEPEHRRRDSSLRTSPPPKRDDTPSERSSRLIRPQERRARSASAQPLSSRSSVSSRILSQTADAIRASDPKQAIKNQLPAKKVEKLRRALMSTAGGRARANSLEQTIPGVDAWVISADDTKAEYNTALLVNAEKVPELWNEAGNLTICLRSPDSGVGPSFKIPYPAIASSLILVELIQDVNFPGAFRYRQQPRGYDRGYDSLYVDDPARPSSYVSSHSGSESPGEYSLHIPPLPQDAGPNALPTLDRLVAIRNLFAFLTGQPLVATKTQANAFAAFLQIAALLEEFAFASPEGSSFGSEVDLSFGFYVRQLGLGDVRNSREKTIQGLLIAERMRSVDLYNEVFAHAVGKFPALVNLQSPTWPRVSSLTRQRLDRAHLDLLNRQHNVNVRIEQFDFPSLFSGIANSTSSVEFRAVRFKQWRSSFSKMRSFTMSYYKRMFGSWPPKASSRKNPFTESGLNRLVLKTLYWDMCALYDLIADRKSFTTRVINKSAEETETEAEANPVVTALRRMLSESDNSSPPVLPPIPFDVPKLPTMSSISASYDKLQPKEQARFDRGIKGHELKLILEKSYDYNTNTTHGNNEFLQKFKEFEAKEARGKVGADIADQRIGYWLFLYVVIQSLPILVVDAPGLMHTEDVEYFLCQPPVGNPPWAENVDQVRKMWYEVSGGAGYVELAADAVLFSVEAIHHRSHCWLQAKMWEAAMHEDDDHHSHTPDMTHDGRPGTALPYGLDSGAVSPSTLSIDTSPSPALGASPIIRPRNQSPGPLQPPMMRQGHRSSVVLGIEPVFDLPEGLTVPGERSSRVFSQSSSHDRSNSLGPSPLGDIYKHRSVSVGNLSALATVQSAGSSEGGSQPGATFDDILGKSSGKKEKKRKSFFFA